MQAEKIIVKSAKPERKFFKIYYDFLYNKILNGNEKLIFIVLKSFLDFSLDKEGTHGEAFPTIQTICEITEWGNKKVIRVINSLVEKGVVQRIQRGLNKPNLYILSDYAAIWAAENIKEAREIVENDGTKPMTAEEHIEELKKLGYDVEIKKVEKAVPEKTEVKEEETISGEEVAVTGETMLETKEFMTKEETLTVSEDAGTKEKGLVPESNQITGTSNNNQLNNTTPVIKSQVPERYTLNQIKQFFDYDIILYDYPDYQEKIDSVMSILHTALNTTKETIRINGENKPAMVVISKLMKLNKDSIIYVINKFSEQTSRIKNPTAYMLTLLYNAPEQHYLDISNLVQHDMYGTPEQTPEAGLTDMQPAAGQSPRQHIPEKEGSGTFE